MLNSLRPVQYATEAPEKPWENKTLPSRTCHPKRSSSVRNHNFACFKNVAKKASQEPLPAVPAFRCYRGSGLKQQERRTVKRFRLNPQVGTWAIVRRATYCAILLFYATLFHSPLDWIPRELVPPSPTRCVNVATVSNRAGSSLEIFNLNLYMSLTLSLSFSVVLGVVVQFGVSFFYGILPLAYDISIQMRK